MKISFPKIFLFVSVTCMSLALFVSPARAESYNLNYITSLGDTVNASFTTNDALQNNVGDFPGLTGFAITSITGQRNLVAIDGLISNGASPHSFGSGPITFDNILLSTIGFDNNGLYFSAGGPGGRRYNVFSDASPMGPTYTEITVLAGGGFYQTAISSLSITLSQNIVSVTEATGTLFLLALSLVMMVCIGRYRKHHSVNATA